MQRTPAEVIAMTPAKLTIVQLMSVLSEFGVVLPTSRERKAVYVHLLETLQKRLLSEAKKRRSPARQVPRKIDFTLESIDSPALSGLSNRKKKNTRRRQSTTRSFDDDNDEDDNNNNDDNRFAAFEFDEEDHSDEDDDASELGRSDSEDDDEEESLDDDALSDSNGAADASRSRDVAAPSSAKRLSLVIDNGPTAGSLIIDWLMFVTVVALSVYALSHAFRFILGDASMQ